MGDNTEIAYVHHTFNPVIGCTKRSPGCANCFAEHSTPARAFGVKWGDDEDRYVTKNWSAPLRWNRAATERERVMLTLSDWLDPKWPLPVLARFLDMVRLTPNLDWLLLTKLPELWRDRTGLACDLNDGKPMVSNETYEWIMDWRLRHKAPRNVWVIASTENQDCLDKRAPELLKIPAVVHGLSCEPLLGPIDASLWLGDLGGRRSAAIKGFDLVIVGGESGKNARPCNVEWPRSLKNQCQAAKVRLFMKQMGACFVDEKNGVCGHGVKWPYDILPNGPTRRLVHPKGGDMAEWPEDLRVRQFPEVRR